MNILAFIITFLLIPVIFAIIIALIKLWWLSVMYVIDTWNDIKKNHKTIKGIQ
jgi:hypothetical protein